MEQILSLFPGWFEDILDMQIFYDADLEVPVTPYTGKNLAAGPEEDNVQLFYRQALFSAGAIVQGYARIRAPPGSSVRHEGIAARLESNFLAMGDIATRELVTETLELVPPGYIAGTVDVPFRFECAAMSPLQEYYEGGLFSIRHSVHVTVARPWYTFAVSASAPFAVQRVHDIPQPSVSARRGTEEQGGVEPSPPPPPGPLSMEAQLALYGQQECAVDLLGAGSLALILDKGCYELTDRLSGTIEVTGATQPIVMLRFALVKVEYADGEVQDSVIYEDTLLDARRWRMRKLAKARGEVAEDGDAAVLPSAGAEKPEGAAAVAIADDDAALAAEGGGHPALAVSASPAERTAAAAAALTRDAAATTAAEEEEGALDAVGEDGEVDWWPALEELLGDDVDPDVPLVGDGNINIALELRMLEIAAPTVVIPPEPGAAPAPAPPAAGAGAAGGAAAAAPSPPEDAISVRYFVRLSAYTGFSTEARHWNAMEVVLYREGLYGRTVPASRLPAVLAPNAGQLTLDDPAAAGASESTAGGAAAATASSSSVRSGAQDSQPAADLPAGAASPNSRVKRQQRSALDVEEGLSGDFEGLGIAGIMTREATLQPSAVEGSEPLSRAQIVAQSLVEADIDPEALRRH